jgi:hypothetical protein
MEADGVPILATGKNPHARTTAIPAHTWPGQS